MLLIIFCLLVKFQSKGKKQGWKLCKTSCCSYARPAQPGPIRLLGQFRSHSVIKLVPVLFGKCTTLVVTKCWPMETRLPCGGRWKAEKLGAFWRWPVTRRFIKNDKAGLIIEHSINLRLNGRAVFFALFIYLFIFINLLSIYCVFLLGQDAIIMIQRQITQTPTVSQQIKKKKSLTFFCIPFIVLCVISCSNVIIIHMQYYEINIV